MTFFTLLQIQDLNTNEKASPSHTASLRDLVGFGSEEIRIGRPRKQLNVREAVVAIPFTRDQKGQMRFQPVSKGLVGYAVQAIKVGGDVVGNAGPVGDMVKKMIRYVFPPKLDFITNPKVNPFAMFIFEFKHTFTQDDITDIWQNLPPNSLMNIQEPKGSRAILSTDLMDSSFYTGGGISPTTEWLVFKVKQKAARNYFLKTKNTADDEAYNFIAAPLQAALTQEVVFDGTQGGDLQVIDAENVEGQNFIPDYSYNWPYDFFSMVELIQMRGKVKIR